MRIQRLAAAAAATALAASLVGCSDAKDAADKAKSAASSAASSVGTQAKEKASDAASKAADKVKDHVKEKAREKGRALFEDATAKLSPEAQKKVASLATVGLGAKGQLADDDDSVTVAEFFGARQAMTADTGMDRTALEAVSDGAALRNATVYVSRYMNKKIPFSVDVISSENGTVEACVGAKADRPRTLTVKDGKVVTNVAGDHTC